MYRGAVEIVTIHPNPKRGNDLATSLALRVSVRHNREQYSEVVSRVLADASG